MPRLSVVIPTRDRPELLAACLRTLAVQEPVPGGVEVLVVDDGSSVDLAPIVERFADSPVPMAIERQQPSGLNDGRNRGAACTSGELLAYLDDDTLVAPPWAREVVAGFDATGTAAIAGRTELQLEGPTPRWLTDKLRLYLSELDLGAEPRPLEPGEWPVGANCAVTRAAFDDVGGFRTGLDRSGRSLVSNGDIEFFERVRRAGHPLVYWPAASVVHRVPPDRLTTEWFRRRVRAQGVSDALVAERRGRSREMLRIARTVPIFAKGVLTGRGATGAQLWIEYCRGRLTVSEGA